jgi:arginase family enzyme
MHPVKSRIAIRSAYSVYHVRHFSLDCHDELMKIIEETDGAKDLRLHVRITIPNSYAELGLADKFPFVFGGEHSITARAITPFVKRYPNLAILHFDAHADLRDSYDGEKYSHACAMRRCLDYPNIELVSCGIRSISAEEIPFLEKNKHRIRTYWAKDKAQWDLNEIVSHLKGRPVYLTFDLDAFDSSLMAHLSQVDCFGKRQLI